MLLLEKILPSSASSEGTLASKQVSPASVVHSKPIGAIVYWRWMAKLLLSWASEKETLKKVGGGMEDPEAINRQ